MTASPHTVVALALALLEANEHGFASLAVFNMIERLAGMEDVSENEVLHELIQLNGTDADRKRHCTPHSRGSRLKPAQAALSRGCDFQSWLKLWGRKADTRV